MNQSVHMVSVLREFLFGEAFTLNVANVPLAKARKFAEKELGEENKSLDDLIPDFDRNYQRLSKMVKAAPDIPRIDMPVIEPKDIPQFEGDLKAGRIDIFKPFALGMLEFPTDLLEKPAKAKEWINLGQKDGDPNDDVVRGKLKKISAVNLKPIQGQVWLERLVANIGQFGIPNESSPIAKTTIIVSKDGFILDGHHRWGQAMLANPTLKINTLVVPLSIDLLLKVGRSWGNAIGNKQKQ